MGSLKKKSDAKYCMAMMMKHILIVPLYEKLIYFFYRYLRNKGYNGGLSLF